jgi:chromosome partitioning protein
VTVLSVEGGVGKTVTAVHLAGFSAIRPRIAGRWRRHAVGKLCGPGPGKLPFRVVPERQLGLELAQNRYSSMVVNTEANPPDDDFVELVNGCHFAVIPATPDALGLQSAVQTTAKLRRARPDMPSECC